MSDLPTLKPVKPVAICGHCNGEVYLDGRCQIASGHQPPQCCLNGAEFRRIKLAHDMQNSYVSDDPRF